MTWTYQQPFDTHCFTMRVDGCPHSSSVLAKQRVEQRELIWPWLSCEVERCNVQDEPDTLLPKTCRWEVLTCLLMTRLHFFLAWVSTGPKHRHCHRHRHRHRHPTLPHCVDMWGEACHWSMQKPVFKTEPVCLQLLCALRSPQDADAMQRVEHRAGSLGQCYSIRAR